MSFKFPSRIAAVFCLLLALSLPGMALSAETKEDVPPPQFEYIEMKPLTLPVITEKGVMQQVSLIISLETPFGKKLEVENYQPRLADAYLRDLYVALSEDKRLMRNNLIDVDAVKNRLTDITYGIVTREQVTNVLLQVMHQRQM